VSVSARFLTENRDEAVALLRKALTEPRFDEDAVERVRAQVQSIIRSDATDPNRIASRTFDTLAYGDHPYAGRATARSRRGALTRDDIVAAHARAIARDRIYVGAVGDIGPEELGALLDDLLGDLPAEGAPLPPEAEFLLPGGVSVVPFDTPQSVALFGHRHRPGRSRLLRGLRRERDLRRLGLPVAPDAGGPREARPDLRDRHLARHHGPRRNSSWGRSASANDRMAETIEVVRRNGRGSPRKA
jgi:hypothetical protein